MGTSRPINGREAWGRRPPAHPTGGRSKIFSQVPPEGLFANKKLFLFAKKPLTRPRRHPARPTGGRSPEGHPALPTGGRFPGRASGPPNVRDVPPPLYKPPATPKFSYYSAKIKKKRKGGEEERRESGEALFTRRFGGIFSF
jgi:hypothetical protein